MNIWNTIPFVRLLLAFLAGLLLAIYFEALPNLHWLFFLIPPLAYSFFYYRLQLNYRLRYLKGIPILLFFFLFGIKLVQLHTEINFEDHYAQKVIDYYLVKITEPPKKKSNTLKIIGEVIEVRQQQQWIKTSGKILIYLAKEKSSLQLKYGDILLCNSKIEATPAPKNPFEFNYKKYLAFQQIYYQTYIDSKSWVFTNHNKANVILETSYSLSNYLLQIISSHDIKGDEYAIGAALILGYEDDLSNEVIGSFAATGALHVLSVSGLHVGIVYIVLTYLLQYLGDKKAAKISRFILALIGLWLYALLTGLSPSVWRAAAMFSLITIGKFYSKDLNTFNIIACSAFILLMINPFMITEVGFQLSYLAVIGIVILHQKFYELITVRNKILDHIWSISCVSIAAQLVTFPLGLFYFHQFPNYFLFSNLIVIPLSTIILYGGIFLFAVAKVPLIGAMFAKLLNILLWLLKSVVIIFENLPFAVIDGISISAIDTIIIYILLIGIYCFWIYRKLAYINFAIVSSLFFCTLQIVEKMQQLKQQQLVIYSINKHFAVDFIEGNNNVFLGDHILLKDKDKMRFHFLPNWNNLGLNHTKKVDYADSLAIKTTYLRASGSYLFYQNKIILNTAQEIAKLQHLIYKPEIVILNHNNSKRFKQLFKLFPEAVFICDGTISSYYYRNLIHKNPNINMRSVLTEGAITIKV